MGANTRCRKLKAQNIKSVSCTGRFAGQAYARAPIRNQELCDKKDCCVRSKFCVEGRQGGHLRSGAGLMQVENFDDQSQNEGARMALSLATDLYRKAMRSVPAAHYDTCSDQMLNTLLESAHVDALAVAAVAYASAPLSAIEQEETAAKRMLAKLAREQAQARSQLRACTPPRSSRTHATSVDSIKFQKNANGKPARAGHNQDSGNNEYLRESKAVGLTKSCFPQPRSSTQTSTRWGRQIRNYVHGGCICQ